MIWTNKFLRSGAPSGNVAKPVRPGQGGCGMAASLFAFTRTVSIISLLSLLVSGPVSAQSSQGLFWQCATNGGQPQYCPVNNQYPLPMGPGINALVPIAGTQRGTAIASSTGFTIPTGATVALVQFQGTNNGSGQCAFWQDDGTAPTSTAGQAQPTYTQLWMAATTAFKAIAASGATCTMTVSYYK